jgi:hypothetical protein
VIRSTVEKKLGYDPEPPPNQPSVKLLAAVNLSLAKLSGPRTDAVSVSVANVIRCTVERGPPGAALVYPAPNHAAVFSGGGGVKVTPPEKEIPLVNVIVII